MAKLTMHDQIAQLLIAETSAKRPITQPQITQRLRFQKKHGSRATVLNEIQERNAHIHRREMTQDEKRPEHGKARLLWWYDPSHHNGVQGQPKRVLAKRKRTSDKGVAALPPLTGETTMDTVAKASFSRKAFRAIAQEMNPSDAERLLDAVDEAGDETLARFFDIMQQAKNPIPMTADDTFNSLSH